MFTIIYAGQLHEDYGTRVLLEAFGRLEGERWRLVLYGSGTMEDEIRATAARDPRIMFGSFQPAEVIYPAIDAADVVVVPRFSDDRMAEYSFPSKILECMALGKIVICANLPGIPAEYRPHLLILPEMSAEALVRQLRELADWPVEQRREIERNVFDFVWTHKTQEAQGRRIIDFLKSLPRRAT